MIAIKNDGTVIIDTLIDTDGISKGVTDIQTQLTKVSGSIKKIGAAVGIAFGIQQIVQFGKEAISLGSDLEEVQNVVDVTFGELSGTINEFANDALETYGLSVTSAKQYTSTMGAMLKSMGLSTDAAAAMGMELTGLAGDLASFYNLDADDAFAKIRSGISGETEPLKQLGINLSVANLEAYALAQGITKSYNAMSQQEQALLRYNYLLSVTTDAQGDFARTSDSWANQTRILTERFNQLKATIGQGLMAALTPVIKVLNTLLGYLQKVADAFASVMSMLFGKVSTSTETSGAVDSVAESYEGASDAADDYADSTEEAAKAAKRALAGFDELNRMLAPDSEYSDSESEALNTDFADLLPGTTTAETTVEDTISPKIQAIVDKVRELLEPLKNIDLTPLAEAFERLKTAMEPITQKLFEGLEWAWRNLLVPLAAWTIEDLLPAFLDLLSGALNLLNRVIEALQPFAQWLWDSFLQPLAEFTGGLIVDFINSLADALTRLSDWMGEHTEGLQNFVIVLGSIAGSFGAVTLISQVAAAIKDLMLLASGASIAVSPLLGTIMSWIANLGMAFTTAGTKIAGLFSGVSTALTAIATGLGISVGWVVAIVAAVGAAVAAIIIYWDEIVAWAQTIGKSLSNVWQNILLWIEDVKSQYDGLKKKILLWAQETSKVIHEQFIVPIQEWFAELMKKLQEFFESAQKDIQDAFQEAAKYINERFISPVLGWFQSLKEDIKSIYSDIKNAIVASMTNAASLVTEKFITPMKEQFSNASEWIANKFLNAKERIVNIFQSLPEWFSNTVIQPIIKFFNNLISTIVNNFQHTAESVASSIETLLSVFSRVSRSTSYSSGSSGSSYSASAASTYAATPDVPYLAKGAVIPANAPFLAVLGDQRHGTNIEAPLSTIQEAVALVMEDMVQSNLAGHEATVAVLQQILEAVLGIELDGEALSNAVNNYNRKMAVVRGG